MNFKRDHRPSDRELYGKITEALSLVENDRWLPADPVKLKANFDELETRFGIETALVEDQTKILVAVLKEIRPSDYAGSRPPQKSYEKTVKGSEMFAFRWKSPFFCGHEMYFKFCLNGRTANERRAFIFSIHTHVEK